jgi:hypothetical protein
LISDPKTTILSVNKQFQAIDDGISKDIHCLNATFSFYEVSKRDFDMAIQIPSSAF